MGFQNLFGTMLLGAAVTPLALLPPSCTVNTQINFPASTGVRTSTLTYNGPFSAGPFVPLTASLSTYTLVVPTQGPGGVIQSQTYTVIASPIVEPIPPTSSPSPPPPLSTYIPNSTYVGCYKDTGVNGGSLLYGPSAIRDTQEACKAFCDNSPGGPYKYFSIKPVSNCHCGQNLLLRPGQQMGQCTTGCVGNSTQQCGGPSDDSSIWINPPIFRPPPGPGDRDPAAPGDGVDGYPGKHPGRPRPKPPVHPKPHPPPSYPTKPKPHPPPPPPPKSYSYEDSYAGSGYPTYKM